MFFALFSVNNPLNTPNFYSSGQNVEEAFLDTAKKIYQSILEGRLDLNSSESGVQHKPMQPGRTTLGDDTQQNKDNCSC